MSETTHGRLAQLGERRVRNAEVEGSNPLPSTTKPSKNPPKKDGRLAQWESACFTRKRSLVQSQQRPLMNQALRTGHQLQTSALFQFCSRFKTPVERSYRGL